MSHVNKQARIIASVVKFKLAPYIPPRFWGCSRCTRLPL